MSNGSGVGVTTAPNRNIRKIAWRHQPSSRRPLQHAGEVEHHQQQRELEADAEEQHHLGDEAEVPVDVDDDGEVAAGAEEEVQALGDDQVREHDAGGEQRRRDRDEAVGVAALPLVQARAR